MTYDDDESEEGEEEDEPTGNEESKPDSDVKSSHGGSSSVANESEASSVAETIESVEPNEVEEAKADGSDSSAKVEESTEVAVGLLEKTSNPEASSKIESTSDIVDDGVELKIRIPVSGNAKLDEIIRALFKSPPNIAPLRSLQSFLDTREAQLLAKNKEHLQLLDENQKLRNALSSNSEVKKLKMKLKKKDQEYSELMSEGEDLQKELGKLRESNRTFKRQLKQKEDETGSLSKRNVELTQSMKKQSENFTSQQHRKKHDEIQKLNEEIKRLMLRRKEEKEEFTKTENNLRREVENVRMEFEKKRVVFQKTITNLQLTVQHQQMSSDHKFEKLSKEFQQFVQSRKNSTGLDSIIHSFYGDAAHEEGEEEMKTLTIFGEGEEEDQSTSQLQEPIEVGEEERSLSVSPSPSSSKSPRSSRKGSFEWNRNYLLQIQELEKKSEEKERFWLSQKNTLMQDKKILENKLQLMRFDLNKLEKQYEYLKMSQRSSEDEKRASLLHKNERFILLESELRKCQKLVQEKMEDSQEAKKENLNLQNELEKAKREKAFLLGGGLEESSNSKSEVKEENIDEDLPKVEDSNDTLMTEEGKEKEGDETSKLRGENSRLRYQMKNLEERLSKELQKINIRYRTAKEIITEKNDEIKVVKDEMQYVKKKFQDQVLHLLGKIEEKNGKKKKEEKK